MITRRKAHVVRICVPKHSKESLYMDSLVVLLHEKAEVSGCAVVALMLLLLLLVICSWHCLSAGLEHIVYWTGVYVSYQPMASHSTELQGFSTQQVCMGQCMQEASVHSIFLLQHTWQWHHEIQKSWVQCHSLSCL